MRSYRVYRLNPGGKIVSADWVHAAGEAAAKVKAAELCEPGVPTVELWEGSRRLAILKCDDRSGDPKRK